MGVVDRQLRQDGCAGGWGKAANLPRWEGMEIGVMWSMDKKSVSKAEQEMPSDGGYRTLLRECVCKYKI